MTYRLQRECLLHLPLREVFAFFENPRNLASLTPPWLNFRMLNADSVRMQEGAQIDYLIRWAGLKLRWRTRITRYDPPRRFVDLQERGPYSYWRHEHTFEETPGGIRVRDQVDYRLPFGLFGRIAHALVVRRQLEQIFDYRETALRRLLASQP